MCKSSKLCGSSTCIEANGATVYVSVYAWLRATGILLCSNSCVLHLMKEELVLVVRSLNDMLDPRGVVSSMTDGFMVVLCATVWTYWQVQDGTVTNLNDDIKIITTVQGCVFERTRTVVIKSYIRSTPQDNGERVRVPLLWNFFFLKKGGERCTSMRICLKISIGENEVMS